VRRTYITANRGYGLIFTKGVGVENCNVFKVDNNAALGIDTL
jgi:hypothetical protein